MSRAVTDRIIFLFDCIGCTEEELELIEAYEEKDGKVDATKGQKTAILDLGYFDRNTLFSDYAVEVKQFQYEGKNLVCVKWSMIHHFFEII